MAPPGTVPMMTRMIPLCANADRIRGAGSAAKESASQTMPRRFIEESFFASKVAKARINSSTGARTTKLACSADEKICLHRALTFDFQRAARLEFEIVAKHAIRFSRDVDTAGSAEAFHAARGIHRVAPDIINELVRANHAGHDRTNMNPDPDFQIDIQSGAHTLHDVQHLDKTSKPLMPGIIRSSRIRSKFSTSKRSSAPTPLS